MNRKAIFSGSFDPYTKGHDAIVQRGLLLFDEIIIAVGIHFEKKTFFALEKRMADIKALYRNESRISVVSYDTLTTDLAKQLDVSFLLRGVRNTIDFEYEKNLAEINRNLSGIETVFLFSEPEFAYISSSLVCELIKYNHDISHLIPQLK